MLTSELRRGATLCQKPPGATLKLESMRLQPKVAQRLMKTHEVQDSRSNLLSSFEYACIPEQPCVRGSHA